MSDHDPQSVPLRRIHRDTTALACDIYGSRIHYDALPLAMVASEFDIGLRKNIDLFFHSVLTNSDPTDAELQPMVDLALERIRDGADLSEIIRAYHEVARMLWEDLIDEADEERLRTLAQLVPAMVRHISEIISRIKLAAADLGSTSVARSEARRAFTAALLTGAAPADLAAQARVTVASRYQVLDLAVAPDAPARAVRALERALAKHSALLNPSETGWVALIPILGQRTVATVFGDLRTVCAGVGTFFHAGSAVSSSVAAIPSAVADARALRLISAMRPPSEVPATAEAHAFALFVLRSEHSRGELRELAECVLAQRDLESTLRAYIRCDGNQAATARYLHVHRNTVPYRLSRIAEVGGVDPLTVDGIALLRAALLVRDADAVDG